MQRLAWLSVDVVAMVTCAMLAVAVLGEISPVPRAWSREAGWMVAIIIAVRLAAFAWAGMYRSLMRYAGTGTLVALAVAVGAGTACGIAVAFFLKWPFGCGLGRGFLLLEAMLTIAACGGMRLGVRLGHDFHERARGARLLIYGAGDLGSLVMRGLRGVGAYRVVGFLDDDRRKHGALIHGVPVLGGLDDLAAATQRQRPELLAVAINQLPPERLKHAFNLAMAAGLRVKVVQGVDAMLSGGGRLTLGELALEDLLRRPLRDLDAAPVAAMLRGRTVLVTGAGGSIGAELCLQVAACGAARLVLVDHSEPSLYSIDAALRDRHPGLALAGILADCTDRVAIDRIVAAQAPSVVFHAAAYKHVPLVEDNPCAGIANNVRAYRNVLAACQAHSVERLVLISTDKAVRPANLMGASKRVCELLMLAAPPGSTRLCAVRFGNVLGSSGSVVPRFLAQIRAGGPVTLTHPDITRFFMLIPEAVQLVLQAGAMAAGGEVFILDMGEPVKIADLARQLIWMTGHVPDRDIAITCTGLRPGEKLYEELIKDDSERSTAVDAITVARSGVPDAAVINPAVDALLAACAAADVSALARALSTLVPEWVPSERYRSLVPPAPALPATPLPAR